MFLSSTYLQTVTNSKSDFLGVSEQEALALFILAIILFSVYFFFIVSLVFWCYGRLHRK